VACLSLCQTLHRKVDVCRQLPMEGTPSCALSGNSSSDYVEADDPDFLDSLLRIKLPGDAPRSSQGSEARDDTSTVKEQVQDPTNVHKSLKRPRPASQELIRNPEEDLDTYGASRFGHFGEYMRRKRAKLQIQNTHLEGMDGSSNIFNGLAIYVCPLFDTPKHGSLVWALDQWLD
jgi:DNA repair protein REV1